MTIAEIKKAILGKINEVDDDVILEEVYRILQRSTNSIELFRFSSSQHQALDKIDEEMDKGDSVTHEQAEKDLDEWLK